MADDTVAYLETAVQDRAHLVGWSDGAVVAVLVPLARPEIDLTELAAITAPTLVLQGDRDEVTLQHSLAVVAALPEARLAVLPGTHGLPVESPETVNAVLRQFLGGGPPVRLF